MQAQAADSSQEITRLRRCINDLVSVLALPAMWSGNEPSAVIDTLLDALLRMLQLDFIYARVRDPLGNRPLERVRVAESKARQLTHREVSELVRQSFAGNGKKSFPSPPDGTGEHISCVPLQLGVSGEIGMIVAGSQRPGFPDENERLILSVAANEASIGLQEGRLLSEQKRVASELDQHVAQRTAELANANEELRKEIADRKKVEEQLRESEAALQNAFDEIKQSESKLRQVIDTIPTLAWCNLADGPNEFLNKGWHEYTGLSPEESHGWAWQTAFHQDDLPPLMKRWGELLVSGEPGEIEARLRRNDGIYRWFLIRIAPFRNNAGKIVRWYGTSTDIDDRKRAEEQLRRSEAFLAEGQNLSRIGSFSWLVTTDEIRWSEQLYRIFEFEVGVAVTFDLIGSRIHPEDLPLMYDMIERARCAVSTVEYAHRLRMLDGSIKYLHLIAHANRDHEGRLEYIGAVQDVTQRRVSEEALGKARSELAKVARITSLGVLTASIAHEVNQPLSGIITNASTCLRMLSAEPPNVDGARETARRTIRDGNRASDVITRLRALFSKKDDCVGAVDLNDAAQEVIALLTSDLQRNRVILRPQLADNLPPIAGDRVQLQQVVLNLLRNASEAMSTVNDRPRELLIKTERTDGDDVCLSVTDVGVGFDTQAADRLFEAFYTTKNDGMGIGLSVSRSIVERHHGRLWAVPNEGPGATFSFSVPYRSEGRTEAA